MATDTLAHPQAGAYRHLLERMVAANGNTPSEIPKLINDAQVVLQITDEGKEDADTLMAYKRSLDALGKRINELNNRLQVHFLLLNQLETIFECEWDDALLREFEDDVQRGRTEDGLRRILAGLKHAFRRMVKQSLHPENKS